MKVRLAVSAERYDEIRRQLMEHGIETDDTAELVLSEANRFSGFLTVRDMVTSERVILPVEDIAYVETRGHLVEVHTENGVYQGMDRLYKIVNMLDPEKFLRVSNSAVVAVEKIRRITPTFSMKFILTMSDGGSVDVTRSYYYIFKDFFAI